MKLRPIGFGDLQRRADSRERNEAVLLAAGRAALARYLASPSPERHRDLAFAWGAYIRATDHGRITQTARHWDRVLG